MITWPASGRIRKLAQRIKVLLPAPLLPTKAVIVPLGNETEIFFKIPLISCQLDPRSSLKNIPFYVEISTRERLCLESSI